MSHAVASAIHVAVEHAESLRRLIEGCTTCNPNRLNFGLNSYYSLLRGALENAARAIWLLAPDTRPERVLRRLQLQADNIVNSEKAARAMGASMPRPLNVRLDRVREIAVRAGLDERLAVKRPGNLEIVRAAGRFLGEDEDHADHTEAIWRSCSGAAHGDAWAGLSLHEREVRNSDGHVGTYEITASTHLLTTITSETFTLVTTAFRVFDLRNRPLF